MHILIYDASGCQEKEYQTSWGPAGDYGDRDYQVTSSGTLAVTLVGTEVVVQFLIQFQTVLFFMTTKLYPLRCVVSLQFTIQ